MNDPTEITTDTGPSARMAREAARLIEVARERDITLRALGSVGVYMRTPRPALFEAIRRPPVKDIDLIAPSDDRNRMRGLFEGLGYVTDEDMLWSSEGRRFAFASQGQGGQEVVVDVFVDELRMCHTLRLKSRLHLHPLTASLADLLLQKLQIVELTVTDRQDVGVLLLEHALGDEGSDAIDLDYVTGVLSDDWGFCHTVLANLAKLRETIEDANFDASQSAVIASRATELADAVDRAPKNRRWKARARIGERKKWYQAVEEERDALL